MTTKVKPIAELVQGTIQQPIRQKRPLTPAHAAVVAERKARLPGPTKPLPTRDVLLQKQYELVNSAAPAILERLIRGAQDETDPLHERCLDIMAKRVSPLAFFEALAKQEFRPEEEQNRTPTIVINVTGAAGLEMLDHSPIDVDAEERG